MELKVEKKHSFSKRTISRLIAVQILFANDFNEINYDDLDRVLDDHIEAVCQEEIYSILRDIGVNKEFVKNLILGIKEHCEKILTLIVDSLNENWSITRLEPTIRSILMCGTCELLEYRDVLHNIILGEYIKIADVFLSSQEIRFVNGVLNNIAKLTRAS